jgi:3-oxoacyl-[acyl-carrier-protein] synthase II
MLGEAGTPRVPRVAVTGLGLLTGLGLDLESSWRGLLEGRSATARFRSFDPTGLPCTFGVELPPEAEGLFAAHIKPRQRAQMTRGTMIAYVTALQALQHARLEERVGDRARVGVVLGATGTGYAPRDGALDEHRILRNMASASAAWVSLKGKFQGPSCVVSTACSSGAYALHTAVLLLATGQCDVVLAGAADSAISFLDVQGFCSLMALSEDVPDVACASRPFDLRRTGFVIGEGGGVLVLETQDFARRTGARVLAELSLPGLCCEGYNIISPEPGGLSMARAMRLALENAGLQPEDIGYLNAHGTSTQLNDLYETQAIRAVFGEHAARLPVSSTKSMTGHCLSAAAGVEAVISVMALVDGWLPPTRNLEQPDPALGLDFVPGRARHVAPAEPRHVMSNSFAFGGQNGVCIFSRCP